MQLPLYRMIRGAIAVALLCLPALSVQAQAIRSERGTGEATGRTLNTVQLLLTVVWQGRDLQPYNLAALERFRERFGDVSVLHLLSPAYYTKPKVDQDDVTASLRRLMRPGDQLGLQLGNWRSLAEAAGVIFRSSPTFWGYDLQPADCAVDCGLDVPVNIYPQGEIDKLLQTSLRTLAEHGFGRPRGLAVEGWTASPALLEAASRLGFTHDFSAVAPELLSSRAKYYPLYRWVKAAWPQMTPYTQPHALALPHGSMTEVPQSLASIDYMNSHDVLTLFKEYTERLHRDPQTPLTFPLVIYQETAMASLPLLAQSLQEVFAYAQKNGVSIMPMRLPGLELPAPVGMAVAH